MLLSELPQAIQENLIKERLELQTNWYKNDAYNLVLVNKAGTRFFVARRHNDFYGSGCTYNKWRISYGMIQWKKSTTCEFGFTLTTYKWVQGKTFGRVNDVVIPRTLDKKTQVIELAKSIGIFEI